MAAFDTGFNLSQQVGLQGNVAVPGVNRPAGITVQPVDTTLMNQLAEWGGKALRDAAAVEQNKQQVDGAMAYAQGQAVPSKETLDGRWQAEGYHQLEAQTLSSAMLAAQQEEIRNSGYKLTPEAFRAQYVERLGSVIAGKDPRVQGLIKEQLMAQMPTLADEHMRANMAYNRTRNMSAGVSAIRTVSRDPTADTAALVAPTGPMGGLSEPERAAVITDGVVQAFEDDNPAAYDQLQAAGAMDGLSAEQMQTVTAAQSAFQNRQMNAREDARIAREDALHSSIVSGAATPAAVAAEQTDIWLTTTAGGNFGLSGNAEATVMVGEAISTAGIPEQQTAYAETMPMIKSIDEAFANGRMSADQWTTNRAEWINKYNAQLAPAPVPRDPNTAEAARHAAILSGQPDPGIDPAVIDAEERARHVALMAGALQDRADKSVGAAMLDSENKAVAMRAANSGYLASVLPDQAATAFDTKMTEVRNALAKAKAANPALSEEELTAAYQDSAMQLMSETGYVPPDYRANYSTVMLGGLLTDKGLPSPEAISTVTDYARMTAINPKAAALMLTPDAKAKADVIMKMAGNNPARFASAISSFGDTGLAATAKPVHEFLADPSTQEALTSATASVLQTDKWFSGLRAPEAWTGATWNPSVQKPFQDQVMIEAERIYRQTNGRGSAMAVVQTAAQTVAGSMGVLGGVPFVANNPDGSLIDLGTEMFGAGTANINGPKSVKEELVSNPSSMDNAVRMWISDHAGDGRVLPPQTDDPARMQPAPYDHWYNYDVTLGMAAYHAVQNAIWPVSKEERMAAISYEPLMVAKTPTGTFLRISVDIPGRDFPVETMVPLRDAGSSYVAYQTAPYTSKPTAPSAPAEPQPLPTDNPYPSNSAGDEYDPLMDQIVHGN